MVVIGLTGSIGAGKSETSRVLAGHGAVIIDTAILGHEAYRVGTAVWEAVTQTFGQEVVLPDLQVDRKKLGDLVFKDPAALAHLNSIMRPAIEDLILERLQEAEAQGALAAVIDSATLVEAGWTALADEVWVTTAPRASIFRRLRDRNGLSDEAIATRLAAQVTDEERTALADVVIRNNGSLADLQATVDALWEERIQAKAGNHGAA